MTLEPRELPAWQLARRRRIVEAAAELLEARPYDAIAMRDVAEAGGVALGTLYRYFASKELLYAEVLCWWRDWATESVPVRGETAAERLRAKAAATVEAVRRRPHFFTMELALQGSTDPEVRASQRAWSAAGRAWLAADLAVLGPERADRSATMLAGVIDHVLRDATLHGASFEEGLAVVEDLVGLLAGPLADAEGPDRN